MGEDTEAYRELKSLIHASKTRRLENADKRLMKIGLKPEIDYVWVNDYMIKITVGEKQWTFWPSKSKWKRHFWNKEIKQGLEYLRNDIKLEMRRIAGDPNKKEDE